MGAHDCSLGSLPRLHTKLAVFDDLKSVPHSLASHRRRRGGDSHAAQPGAVLLSVKTSLAARSRLRFNPATQLRGTRVGLFLQEL